MEKEDKNQYPFAVVLHDKRLSNHVELCTEKFRISFHWTDKKNASWRGRLTVQYWRASSRRFTLKWMRANFTNNFVASIDILKCSPSVCGVGRKKKKKSWNFIHFHVSERETFETWVSLKEPFWRARIFLISFDIFFPGRFTRKAKGPRRNAYEYLTQHWFTWSVKRRSGSPEFLSPLHSD